MRIVVLTLACAAALPVAAQQPAAKPAEEPTDSAVAAVLATKPTTPAECIRAAKILSDLKRPDLAKPLLKKALDANLDQAQLVELGQGGGVAILTEMADRKALQPEARKLADAVSAAIRAEAQNAERIEELIRQLQDPSAEKRLQAVVGLQEARDAALRPLVAVLADPTRAAEWPNVRAALVEMGRAAVGPLTALVGHADPKLTVQAIETLAATNDRNAAMHLLAPCLSEESPPEVKAAAAKALERLVGGVPSRDEAIKLLTESARASFRSSSAGRGCGGGKSAGLAMERIETAAYGAQRFVGRGRPGSGRPLCAGRLFVGPAPAPAPPAALDHDARRRGP